MKYFYRILTSQVKKLLTQFQASPGIEWSRRQRGTLELATSPPTTTTMHFVNYSQGFQRVITKSPALLLGWTLENVQKRKILNHPWMNFYTTWSKTVVTSFTTLE